MCLVELVVLFIVSICLCFFFFNDTATTEIYTLSLHDALPISAIAVYVEGTPPLNLSASVWAALAYMAILGTAVAYLLFYRVLAVAGAGNLLLVTLLIPPVAIVLGATVLGEALSARAFVGFAILAIGMLIMDGRILRIWTRQS